MSLNSTHGLKPSHHFLPEVATLLKRVATLSKPASGKLAPMSIGTDGIPSLTLML